MAGQANGGQVVPPRGVSGGNPMDQGRYVGNPNHFNMPPRGVISNTGMVNPQYNLQNQPQGSISRLPTDGISGEIPTGNGRPNGINIDFKKGSFDQIVPEYMKGFNGLNGQAGTMDSRMYTLNGEQKFGGSTMVRIKSRWSTKHA